jgi:hypothetical protein
MIIKLYQKSKNNFKMLGIKNLPSELLDKFKDKGIKIVDYDSIYKKSDYTEIAEIEIFRKTDRWS